MVSVAYWMTLDSYGNGKKHGAAESHIVKNTTMGNLHCCVRSAYFAKFVFLDMQMLQLT